MILDFTDEERDVLRRALSTYVSDLREEIKNAASSRLDNAPGEVVRIAPSDDACLPDSSAALR